MNHMSCSQQYREEPWNWSPRRQRKYTTRNPRSLDLRALSSHVFTFRMCKRKKDSSCPSYMLQRMKGHMNIMWTADIQMKWRCDHRTWDCDLSNRKHKGDDHTFISIKGNVISEWEIPLVSRLVIGNCYISTARRSPQICIFYNWKQYCEPCTQQVFVFWHFAAVLFLLTTWNEQFCLCADQVSTWGQIFNVFVKLETAPQ